MRQEVESYIRQHNLLERQALHLVALSGGADSVALLRILHDLNYKIEAVHCNFRLRGSESDRDEAFCKELCSSLGISLHIAHFDTKAYSQLHHVSIEMAARELRYNYFFRLIDDLQAQDICVAHHKDDNAETVLINLIRGTGINGLAGIKPRNGKVIRPLLCVERKEIINYLASISQTYVTDSSNLVDDVTRNKIRLNILPLLKEINPSVVNSITATAQHINEALPLTAEATDRWIDCCLNASQSMVSGRDEKTDRTPVRLNIDSLLSSPSPRHVLFRFLERYSIPPATISQIADNLDARTGATWSHDNHIITLDRGHIVIDRRQDRQEELKLWVDGTYSLANDKALKIEYIERTDSTSIDTSPYVAMIDEATIQKPLRLRTVREGDRFRPLGMKGSKLVSDFLTDRKVPVNEKRNQLCITDANDNIVWLIGHRIGHGQRITPQTIKIIKLRYIIGEERK